MKTKKTKSAKEHEVRVAVLTINDAGSLSMETRRSVAKWLREEASDLTKSDLKYAKTFRARYIIDRRIK